MASPFIVNHRILLQTYIEAPARESAGTLERDLEQIRETVRGAQCADLLTAYERYLRMIALRLDAPDLPDRLTLLESDYFETALKRDPSVPFVMLGAAMAHLKEGQGRRARQLLRRLAASQYAERKLAQRILRELVSDLVSEKEAVG